MLNDLKFKVTYRHLSIKIPGSRVRVHHELRSVPVHESIDWWQRRNVPILNSEVPRHEDEIFQFQRQVRMKCSNHIWRWDNWQECTTMSAQDGGINNNNLDKRESNSKSRGGPVPALQMTYWINLHLHVEFSSQTIWIKVD